MGTSTLIEVECSRCHVVIMRPRKLVEQRMSGGRQIFCSRSCKVVWIEWDCEICGKHVKKMRRDVPSPHKRRFCSPACANIGNKGDGNIWWKGGYEPIASGSKWNIARKSARERDVYKCQDCGISEKDLGKGLDVHHLVRDLPKERIHELNNLVSLCHSCHIKREWQQMERKEV